jgi:hypothetical protein
MKDTGLVVFYILCVPLTVAAVQVLSHLHIFWK